MHGGVDGRMGEWLEKRWEDNRIEGGIDGGMGGCLDGGIDEKMSKLLEGEWMEILVVRRMDVWWRVG